MACDAEISRARAKKKASHNILSRGLSALGAQSHHSDKSQETRQ